MSERQPADHPPEPPEQPAVTERGRQRQEDFSSSSPDLQDELKHRDEAEAWDLYESAHEISRENALAGVRSRLHRLEQSGVEVTPEMEQRELEHAEQSLHEETRPRDKKGKFKKGSVEKFDIATASGLNDAVREQEYIDEADRASERTNRKIDRSKSREAVAVEDLGEQLRREDALANVENHIAKTAEQGARWWPWEKVLARRQALRELRDKDLSEDWLAYARERYHEQQDAYLQNGESLSESRRALSASGDRIKGTWQKGGLKRLFTIPAQLVAEGARLGWHGIKRGRTEARAQQKRSSQQNS